MAAILASFSIFANINPLWLNLGLTAQRHGVGGLASINYNTYDNQLLTIEAIGVTPVLGTYDNVSTYNVLYGFMKKESKWYVSGSVGAGVARFKQDFYTKTLNDHEENKTEFNLPAEAQLFWTPFKYFGVGVIADVGYYFGSKLYTKSDDYYRNESKFHYGAAIAIQVGLLNN